MTKIIQSQIAYQQFPQDIFNKILRVLETIPSECYERKETSKIMNYILNITEESKEDLLWIVAIEPAYYVQYKKASSAIFVISGTTIIVFRPKYLEYPQIRKMPKFDEQKQAQHKVELLEVGPQFTTRAYPEELTKFVNNFYATFYNNDKVSEFQTELLKAVKHHLSTISKYFYWHCILATRKTEISHYQNIPARITIKIEGKGQEKHLYLFSVKGTNNRFKEILKNKWKQLLSFIFLFMLLITVVMCPSNTEISGNPAKQTYCANKSSLFYAAGGFFMLVMGMKLTRKKPKFKDQ